MKTKEFNSLFNNSDGLIYLALEMLSKNEKNIIPELLCILSREDLLKFISVYGGETIYIPKPEELRSSLRKSIACYHRLFQNKDWKTIKKAMEMSDKELRETRQYFKKWKDTCSEEDLQLLKKSQKSLEVTDV